jgi:hypothetical protein
MKILLRLDGNKPASKNKQISFPEPSAYSARLFVCDKYGTVTMTLSGNLKAEKPPRDGFSAFNFLL